MKRLMNILFAVVLGFALLSLLPISEAQGGYGWHGGWGGYHRGFYGWGYYGGGAIIHDGITRFIGDFL